HHPGLGVTRDRARLRGDAQRGVHVVAERGQQRIIQRGASLRMFTRYRDRTDRGVAAPSRRRRLTGANPTIETVGFPTWLKPSNSQATAARPAAIWPDRPADPARA